MTDHPQPASVLVSETGVERHQMIGRSGASVMVLGGAPRSEELRSGPGPFELMAAALAACTVLTLRGCAERKALPIDRVQVNVIHLRRAGDQADIFERSIILDGALDESASQRLLDVAEHCPVATTFKRGSELRTMLSPDFRHATALPPLSDYLQSMEESWQRVG